MTPAAYARDPWFAHGSQDDWSLFSPAYAVVLKLFGVEAGALLTTITGGLLFVLASVLLARSFLRGRLAWLAALLLVSVPLCYSAKGMLFVSEQLRHRPRIRRSTIDDGAGVGRARARVGCLGLACRRHAAAPLDGLGPLAVTVLAMVPPRASALLVLGGSFAAVSLLLAGAWGLVSVIDGDWLMLSRTRRAGVHRLLAP